MKARITIEVELVDDAELRDALEVAEQAVTLLLVHRDHRVVDADAIAVERSER